MKNTEFLWVNPTPELINYINEIKGKSNCELKLRALYAKKDIKKD